MTRPTDDQLGRLLRETFADKEKEVAEPESRSERLPEATKRSRAPIALAAASVLVVLGGVVYAADPAGKPDPTPAQTATSSPAPTAPSQSGSPAPTNNHAALLYGAEAWASAIREMAKWERPTGGWPALMVLDAPHEGAGSPTTEKVRSTPFTADHKLMMERLLADVAPIKWVRSLPTGANVCDGPAASAPYITVAPIGHTPKPEVIQIGISLWRGCLDARWLTYGLVESSGWKVTGTVGPEAVA